MDLYQCGTEEFIADAMQGRLATQISDRFFQEFRYKPPLSEVNAWRNSLGTMANILQLADLREQGVLIDLNVCSRRRWDGDVIRPDLERVLSLRLATGDLDS